VSVQHEIAQRVSVDVGYFRRWYGNFTVVDNRAVSPSDFTTYSITAPGDPRLPLSGQVIGPFFEVNPAKAGLVNNYTTFAGNFGNQYEHWNGVDISINARPRQGVVLQGGLGTGRTSTDNCGLVAQLPGITLLSGNIAVPESQCHVDTNFQTQVKFLGTYLVPKIDVQFGVTFQSAPGPPLNAYESVSPSQTTPQLPSFSGSSVRQINLLQPGSDYIHRANQLDVRLSKLFRTGRYRTSISLDLLNSLNANYVLGANSTYGQTWQAPLAIMNPRLVKFSAQFEF
jgi:hypothetical protein